MYNQVLHFPSPWDEEYSNMLDMSYVSFQLNIGEKIIIEGHSTVFIVTDIQNQFKFNTSMTPLKAIMRNVILEVSE